MVPMTWGEHLPKVQPRINKTQTVYEICLGLVFAYSALHVRLESKSHEKLFVLVVRDSCHAADALDGKN